MPILWLLHEILCHFWWCQANFRCFVLTFCTPYAFSLVFAFTIAFAWWISNLTNTWKTFNQFIGFNCYFYYCKRRRSLVLFSMCEMVTPPVCWIISHISLFFLPFIFIDLKIFVLINVSSAKDKCSNRPNSFATTQFFIFLQSSKLLRVRFGSDTAVMAKWFSY